MKKHPEMEHDDPNAKRVCRTVTANSFGSLPSAANSSSACLISGHYEKGMFGKVIVK
jgi:uncharacterized cupredoxin-like copper-binding protein